MGKCNWILSLLYCSPVKSRFTTYNYTILQPFGQLYWLLEKLRRKTELLVYFAFFALMAAAVLSTIQLARNARPMPRNTDAMTSVG